MYANTTWLIIIRVGWKPEPHLWGASGRRMGGQKTDSIQTLHKILSFCYTCEYSLAIRRVPLVSQLGGVSATQRLGWKIVNKKVSAFGQLMMLRHMTMIRSRRDLRMPRGDRRLVRRWNFRILLAAMTRWFSSHMIFRALFFTFVKVKKMSKGFFCSKVPK